MLPHTIQLMQRAHAVTRNEKLCIYASAKQTISNKNSDVAWFVNALSAAPPPCPENPHKIRLKARSLSGGFLLDDFQKFPICP